MKNKNSIPKLDKKPLSNFNNICIIFDAENIQLHKWYKIIKFYISNKLSRDKFNYAYKIAYYSYHNSHKSNKSWNDSVKSVVLKNPKNLKDFADNAIIRMVKKNKNRKIYVISNDKSLAKKCKSVASNIEIITIKDLKNENVA